MRSLTGPTRPAEIGGYHQDQRFAAGVPSLVECDELTIEGDVRFEKNVTIKGAVSIKSRQGSQAVIKTGTVIDKDLIF